MSRLLQALNLAAICLLGGVLASVLVVRARPQAHARALAEKSDISWPMPETLQLYPAHPGDPVKLVGITKGASQIELGKYRVPVLEADTFSGPNPFDDWLKDASFVVRNQTSTRIVSVGISVVFPARRPNVACHSVFDVSWCDQHPNWCDGGCPTLVERTLQWGRIPAAAATGLEARLQANHVLSSSPVLDKGAPAISRPALALAAGGEVSLSRDGRAEGLTALTDPSRPFSSTMTRVALNEGLDEARGAESCTTVRQYSKLGCAFAEVSKFNIGIDIVYFEDGTIWGNYGYGYAVPNPDGIFTRVDTNDPRAHTLASRPN